MTAYTPPVRRVARGRGHVYLDANGVRVPGVTTITDGGLPKKALIDWAGNATAEYAVDNWERLSDLAPAARLKELKGGRYSERDAAKDRGTQVHRLADRLVRGEQVEVPELIAGHVESYTQFLNDFDVRPILIETVVVSHRHGYAGTTDLVAELLDLDDPQPDPRLRRRETWWLDLKTGRSGIFGETALQLAAYRYADVFIDEDDAEHPVPQVTRAGAVHIRADGYELVPVEAGPVQHRQFLYAKQIKEFDEDSRGLIGAPIVRPTTSTYRLSRVEQQ